MCTSVFTIDNALPFVSVRNWFFFGYWRCSSISFFDLPQSFHWQDPRMTPLEEMVLTASAVSLGLWSQSHIGSESATQGQEQGVHKKMINIKHFHWRWLQKDFAFWKLNVESLWPDRVVLCQENFPWICCPESFFPGGISNPNVLLLVISPA